MQIALRRHFHRRQLPAVARPHLGVEPAVGAVQQLNEPSARHLVAAPHASASASSLSRLVPELIRVETKGFFRG